MKKREKRGAQTRLINPDLSTIKKQIERIRYVSNQIERGRKRLNDNDNNSTNKIDFMSCLTMSVCVDILVSIILGPRLLSMMPLILNSLLFASQTIGYDDMTHLNVEFCFHELQVLLLSVSLTLF